MDGELLATDTTRFATLKKLVDIDLADRREWFGRAERNRAEHFKRTNTKKPVYEGAPNLVDPIIDDLVREPGAHPREPDEHGPARASAREHDRDARSRIREGVLPVDLQHRGYRTGEKGDGAGEEGGGWRSEVGGRRSED